MFDRKAYHKEWYAKNRSKRLEQFKARRDLFRELIDTAKSVPCADCGIEYPVYVMDLDHVDKNKVFHVGAARRLGYSLQQVKDEIAKCEAVCSNCHRIRTFNRAAIV